MRRWGIEPVQINPVGDFLRTYLISPAFFDKFSKVGGPIKAGGISVDQALLIQ